MAKVIWNKGTIAPPESGDYYVIMEAIQNSDPLPSGETLIRKGDIEVTTDWYDSSREAFDSLGVENPIWRVLAWANILLPPIPEGIQDQVRWYFGKEVKHNG